MGLEEPMGLKEIMAGHKIIFRAIAHEVDTVVEADLREICQVLEEVEGRFDKSPNVSMTKSH